MNHNDRVQLLRSAVTNESGRWADFGSRTGAFTLALAQLLRPPSEIYSVDKNKQALKQ